MKVVLRVVDGKANVREIALGADTIIGRGAECSLKIASSDVSRKHCRVRIRGDQVRVTDLGSSNGTTLDGQPLQPNNEVVAEPGSILALGPLKFQLMFEASAPPSAPTGESLEEGMGTWVDAPPVPALSESFGSSVTNLASVFVTASSYNIPAVTPSPVVDSGATPGGAEKGEGPSEGTLFDMNQKDLASIPSIPSMTASASPKAPEKKGWGWFGGKSRKGDDNPPGAPISPPAFVPPVPSPADGDSVLSAGVGTVSDPELFAAESQEAPFDPLAGVNQPPAKPEVDPNFGAALDAFLKQS